MIDFFYKNGIWINSGNLMTMVFMFCTSADHLNIWLRLGILVGDYVFCYILWKLLRIGGETK